ncbi:MAG TPA: response regulator [Rectinemataceae bacterium]|nr:response regulator [Rectinemataceae bacterium]
MATPESFWRAAFVESAQPLVALDWRGVFATWNDSFSGFFRSLAGVEAERFEGSFYELVREREGIRLDYFAAELFLGARQQVEIETPFVDAAGVRRWIAAKLSVIEPGGHEAANANRFLLCAFEDVTDRTAKEKILVAAKEEAERATQTKSLFLANMSHEIRTPIQTILGVLELLGETQLDGEQADYTAQIGFSADVLLALINDILDFSKIEAGKLSLEAADFNLRDLTGQSVDLLALDAHRKGLELLLDIEEEVPALLRGDATRLRQILINLLKNAIKFTNSGFVGLFVARKVEAEREWLRFEVRDTGIGIPEDLRQRLFTPFYQADMSAVRRAGGTGLGLAISRHLVELMEGSIGVLPREPSGSIFWFEIPVALPEFAEEPPLPLLDLETKRLLVVDDNAEARAIAQRIAARNGWETELAASGAEALVCLQKAAAESRAFDVCLIDQDMPSMDGWRLASEIHGDQAIPKTRLVLMVPAGTMGQNAKMKLLRWFAAYLSKPVRPQALLDALEGLGDEESEAAFELEEGEDREEAGGTGSRPAASDESKGRRDLRADKSPAPFKADILVAEDHEVNRELFGLILGKLGLRVDEACDGQEAVEKATERMAKSGTYDVILMDIFMPRLDGYEAAKELRKRGWKGPIIAVTASALKGELEKCLESGMDAILVKPFRKADLEAILTTWLPASRGGRAPERARMPQPRIQAAQATSPQEERPAPSRNGTGAAQADELPGAEPRPEKDIFDWERALETFLGQESTVKNLLERFVAKVRKQLGELSEALERRDFVAFREAAHSIKGAAWNLSAQRLGDAARDAETAGKQGDDQGAVMALTALGNAFDDFSHALRTLGLADKG